MGKSKNKNKKRNNPIGLPSVEESQRTQETMQNEPIEQAYPVLEQVIT